MAIRIKRWLRSAGDAGLFFMMFPANFLARRIPLMNSYRMMKIVSSLACLFAARRRKIIAEEVKLLYGNEFSEKRIRKIVSRSFEIYLKRQVENVAFDSLTEDRLERIVSLEGFEHLERAVEGGRGVILLLAHFGSFLLPPAVLGYRGFKVFQVAGRPLIEQRSFFQKKVFEARKRGTDKMPFQFLLTDTYLGPIVRALKGGSVVVIAFDGRSATEMIEMKLLERVARFSYGPFRLATRTGAVILPTFVIRKRDDRHRMVIEPPMDLQQGTADKKTLSMHTEKYCRIFERYIRHYPCHFAMTLYTHRKEAERGLNPPLFIE